MPKTPIDECPAGIAMDTAVAEALGWKQVSHRLWHTDKGHEKWIDDRDDSWSPSTDISAAWELDGLGWLWDFEEEERGLRVTIFGERGVVAGIFVAWDGAKTTRELIKKAYALGRCRAFLKANGVTEVEDERG